jgi:hypothetical protein
LDNNLGGLILPILYVETSRLKLGEPGDELLNLVNRFQWADWREQRFSDIASESYRRAVAKLASQLAEANFQAESEKSRLPVSTVSLVENLAPVPGEGQADDAPGYLDRLAQAEEAFPKLTSTLTAVTKEVLEIGQIFRQATDDINPTEYQGGVAGVRIARQLSYNLANPVGQIQILGDKFTSELHEADDCIRFLVLQSEEEARTIGGFSSEVKDFFATIKSVSTAAHDSLKALSDMAQRVQLLESLARELRPVVRKLRSGLTRLTEGRNITDSWVSLIERAEATTGETGG